ncbi:MAG: hypothetical protein U0234_03480 [Sandaracinus sp.]
MEPKNDSTWMWVGIGLGCLVVVLATTCITCAGCYWISADSQSAPYQPPPYTPPYTPPPTFAPPPTLLPPPTTFVPPTTLVPPPPTAPSGDAPRLIRATVQTVEGTSTVAVGATCEFNVERRDRDDGTFWCNAQVVCGGQLLYGGPEAGYFPCTLFEGPQRGVVGSDTGTTPVDRDAAFSIDTVQARLEVWDDAHDDVANFHVTAHIDSVE